MNSKVPLPPTLVTTEVINCGRAIKIKWTPPATAESVLSPITGYEINLKSPSADFEHIFNLSSDVHSHEFVGLNANAVYDVNVRAKNSYGLSLSAKERLTTTAGTFELLLFLLFLVSYQNNT